MNTKEARLLSDEQLAAACDAALEQLTPRARAHALAVAGGKTAAEAARELGMSTNGRVLARMKARTRDVHALLLEQRRRKAEESAEAAARWLDGLASEARRAKDFSAAARAKREACLLRGQYPDPRVRVEHELIDTRSITAEEIEVLSRLHHEVRPRLAGQVLDAQVGVPGASVTPLDLALSPTARQGPGISPRALAPQGIDPEEEAPDAA